MTIAELTVLEARLEAAGSPAVRHFRPGADPRAVAETMAAAGVDAHPDIVTLFSWHDGTERVAGSHELPGALISPWQTISLREASDLRSEQQEVDEMTATGELISPSWWPVFGTAMGSAYLAADTAVSPTTPAPLYIVDQAGGKPEYPLGAPDFHSISDFVARLIRVVDDGLLLPSRGAGPRIDFARLPTDLRRLATW